MPTATPIPTATTAPPTPEEHHDEEADDPLAEIRERMESVEAVWTVYFHSNDWRSPGHNTDIGEVFELLKLENIFSHEGYKKINPDAILGIEPDIIIADSLESVLDNPELSGLHMVQDRDHVAHHIFVPSDGYSFDPENHHYVDTVKEFAAFVYPKVFGHLVEKDDDHGDGHKH